MLVVLEFVELVKSFHKCPDRPVVRSGQVTYTAQPCTCLAVVWSILYLFFGETDFGLVDDDDLAYSASTIMVMVSLISV